MDPMTRRKMLAAAAVGGVATAAGSAAAQTQSSGGPPEPIRGKQGADDPGPRDVGIARQVPDLLAPPETDVGSLPNLKWSFSLSHNRLEDGGWARQTTERELPVSKAIAGVDMRLLPGAIRELHWHKQNEWSLMLNGNARITCVDDSGRNFVADVKQGDLWYFPSGLPHSIQALDQGCEFLLVFDDGAFNEDDTFLITQWMAHVPKEVLSKNFNVQPSAFANIPKDELYIFKAPVPPALAQDQENDPAGGVPNPFKFAMMDMQALKCPGGSVRIVDSRNFKAARNIAAAYVEIEPGGMRELHWHPRSPEWQYYISGQARMTVFGSGRKSQTFDYRAGDVGYVPQAMGHYIENTGSEPARYLEMFVGPLYSDVSLQQWLAVVPPELVKQHLNLDDATMAKLPKAEPLVVGSGANGNAPASPQPPPVEAPA